MGYSPWGHKESDTTEQLLTGNNTVSVLYVIFNSFVIIYHIIRLDLYVSMKTTEKPQIAVA